MKSCRGLVLAGALAATIVGGCSANRTNAAGAGGGGAGAGGGAGGSGAQGGVGAGTGGSEAVGGGLSVGSGGGGPVGCADATKGSIYILGSSKEFARFEPQTQALTVLGTLACPGEDLTSTFSMSVDRNGTAWVLFSDGKIFHVNTETVACTATPFVPCQSQFCQFGMGFVADEPGSDAETLHVSGVYNGPPGYGLATIDTATFALTPIADYDALPMSAAELTGTGDARLFGYFQEDPIQLAEIDKTNAHILSQVDLTEIPVGTSWAFAFWGGSFYIMSGPAIRKYDPATKITTVINSNVGFEIVGAGVSTCAPLEEPE